MGLFGGISKLFTNLLGKFSVKVAVDKQLKNAAKIIATAVVANQAGVDITPQQTAVAGSIFMLLDVARNFIKTKFDIKWL